VTPLAALREGLPEGDRSTEAGDDPSWSNSEAFRLFVLGGVGMTTDSVVATDSDIADFENSISIRVTKNVKVILSGELEFKQIETTQL